METCTAHGVSASSEWFWNSTLLGLSPVQTYALSKKKDAVHAVPSLMGQTEMTPGVNMNHEIIEVAMVPQQMIWHDLSMVDDQGAFNIC